MGLDFKRKQSSIYEMAVGTLIFFMMVFPAQFYIIKIVCLLVMIITMQKHIFISRLVGSLIFIYILYGVWATIVSLVKATENPLDIITITIIWPILFIPFICQTYERTQFINLCKIVFIAHTVIVIYDLLYCFSIIYGYSIPNIYPENQIFSFYDTTSRLGFLNLNSITFSAPIIILLWMTGFDIGIKKYILFIVVCLTLFLLFLSGRRSLMGLGIGIIPVTYLFSSLFTSPYRYNIHKSFSLLAIICIIGLSYLIFNYFEIFEGYLNTFTKAFNSDQEPLKFAQSKLLLEQFADSPIEGMGVGKVLFEPSPGRLDLRYQFELQYHLTLAQTGLIGFSLEMTFLIGTLFYGFKLGVRYCNLLLILNIGYLFILIANFTNPVLCSFDFFLSVFIVLSVINSVVIKYKLSYSFSL